jgi:hypothetical protein
VPVQLDHSVLVTWWGGRGGDRWLRKIRHFREPRALGNVRHRTGVRGTFSSQGSPRVMGLVPALERAVPGRASKQPPCANIERAELRSTHEFVGSSKWMSVVRGRVMVL